MPFLFALTLFVSATLLFAVQPMVAKMLLPLLGGTPAVWNTSMVFFQAALLAGYAYAHAAPAWLGRRPQIVFHVCLLLAAVAVLPIGIAQDASPPSEETPIFGALALLAAAVGLPFFALAATAPLLQRWFAGTGHPSARDPYFLYAASNIGSLLALLAYPSVIEPLLSVQAQSRLWAVGYASLIALIAGCGLLAGRGVRREEPSAAPDSSLEHTALPSDSSPGLGTRLHWLALAFVPSSLMLGVTTYLTTDIAAIPLFWVIPLTVYLLSFVLVFARRPWFSHALVCRSMPPLILCLVFLMVSGSTHQLQIGSVMGVHLLALFAASMVCHGELAQRRPPARHLTSFYLCMSLGGVLGGLFNALLAPMIFTRVVEYPLTLVAACLLLPRILLPKSETASSDRAFDIGDLLVPALVGVVTIGLVFGLLGDSETAASAHPLLQSLPGAFSALAVYLVPLFVCFCCAGRSIRFGLSVGALLLVSMACQEYRSHVIHRERGFFGDLHVRHDPTGEYIQLIHGTTMHGMQSRDPEQRREPITYFHQTGPIGQLFAAMPAPQTPRRVAVTGLGVGTLLCYAHQDEHWTYYEIDPAVYRVARDPRFFTYLQDADERGVRVDVVLGDARLKLAHARAAGYDLIVGDAFSSASVPVHLLTRQALDLYLEKLAPRGWLVFNLSNRYLHLEPVLAALAEDAGLTALIRHDGKENVALGKNASTWLVMARSPADLAELARMPGWRPAEREPGIDCWTDDFSNLWQIFLWR